MVPRTRIQFADGAFSVASPKVWNSFAGVCSGREHFRQFKTQDEDVFFTLRLTDFIYFYVVMPSRCKLGTKLQISISLSSSLHNTNKIAFQSKADKPRTGYTDTLFCCCDLDLGPMTLTYEPDLHILKVHLHTKNELSRSSFKRYACITDREADRQTDTQTDATERLTKPHSRMVEICNIIF